MYRNWWHDDFYKWHVYKFPYITFLFNLKDRKNQLFSNLLYLLFPFKKNVHFHFSFPQQVGVEVKKSFSSHSFNLYWEYAGFSIMPYTLGFSFDV